MASRREITEAELTSLSAHATTVPSPSPPPSPDPPSLGCLPPHPPTVDLPSVRAFTDLSDDGFIVPYRSLLTHTSLFCAPSSLCETCTTRKVPPHPRSAHPTHCRLFHLLRFLSLPSLCLILVCASACHIKGGPGVTEPQAWNINAANCMALWEINPLKIAPYTC